MAKLEKIEDLEVWQLSRQLCAQIFNCISSGSFLKDYAPIDQIKRSSGSVMDNIAEGFERSGKQINGFMGYLKFRVERI